MLRRPRADPSTRPQKSQAWARAALSYFAVGRSGLKNRGADGWCLSLIQLLASCSDARVLLGRIASAVPASGPSTRVQAVLLGVAAAVEFASCGASAHTAEYTDTVNDMLGPVVDAWAALTGASGGGGAGAAVEPARAMQALLRGVTREGSAARAVRSPLTAPCEDFVALFTSRVSVSVRHCHSGDDAMEVTVAETIVRAPPLLLHHNERGDDALGVVSALRDVALAALPPLAWDFVCSGCFAAGKRPPPQPPLAPTSAAGAAWLGVAPSTACCAGATVTLDVEPARFLLVQVDHASAGREGELRPFVPPLHGRLVAPVVAGELRLRAAVVRERAARAEAHYVAVVSDGSAPASTADPAGTCRMAAGAAACASPECRASTAGALLRIDDQRVAELGGDDDGSRFAAWCGVGAAGAGAGAGAATANEATGAAKAPTLLAFQRC